MDKKRTHNTRFAASLQCVASPINKNAIVVRLSRKLFKFDGRQQAINVSCHSNTKMIQPENLFPEINKLEDWIVDEGNMKLAIGYSTIFWPEFLVHDDCVFLKSHFSLSNFNNWKETSYIENYSQIEYVINHTHILDLFTSDKQDDITLDQIKYLGHILKEVYETKLKVQFPDRKFVVQFNGDEDCESLIHYEVAFYQKINTTRKPTSGS